MEEGQSHSPFARCHGGMYVVQGFLMGFCFFFSGSTLSCKDEEGKWILEILFA